MSLRCFLVFLLSTPVVTARKHRGQYDSPDFEQRPSNGWSNSDSPSQLLRRVSEREPEIVRVRRIFGTELHRSWDPWSEQGWNLAAWRRPDGLKRSAVDIPENPHTGSGVNSGDTMVDRNIDSAENPDISQRPPNGWSLSHLDSQLLRRLFAVLSRRTAAHKPGMVRITSWDHWEDRRKKRTADIYAGSDMTTTEKESDSDTAKSLLAVEANKVHVPPASFHRYQVSSLGKYVVIKPRRLDGERADKRHIGSLMRNGGPWHGDNRVRSEENIEHERVIGM